MTTKSVREVVLGVTGSIAAYKACEIASLLVKRGVKVTPVMTESATRLVGPTTLEALTGSPVITGMFEPLLNQEVEHINVARRADLFLIAPATANILAKCAHGIADDWLSTTLLATRAPILFAPAMNTDMYGHPATQHNLRALAGRGCHFVGPDSGILACKTVGVGRMAEPVAVVEAAMAILNPKQDLKGRHVAITSGANHEPIDPVRFIGNRSSGKMGRALAMEALRRGAQVTVITGPADVAPPAGCTIVAVETALEMCAALEAALPAADIVIGAAAVADYRLESPLTEKHKRSGEGLTLNLTENPDIIARAGAAKKNGQIVVGFAAETNDLLDNAKKKLAKKNLDLIVANTVGAPDSGFGTDTVKAWILDGDGGVEDLPLSSKSALASALFDRIVSLPSVAPAATANA